MTRYKIPTDFLPGFKTLSQLPEKEVVKLAEILESMPVGMDVQDFRSAIKKEEGLSDESLLPVDAIFSLGGLLLEKKADESVEQLAEDLANAYGRECEETIESGIIDHLSKNLLLLFERSDNLKKTFKAYHLLFENARNYRKGSIVTDMRMIFDDDFEKQHQAGLIIHQMKLEYVENNSLKEFFISLDRDDVIALRKELKRSLDKEECIKRDFDKIQFIEIK